MKDKDEKSFYEKKIEEVTSSFEGVPLKKQKKIIKKERIRANLTNAISSISLILLIVPIMTLGSYMYYGISGKSNDYIDVVLNTMYLTEPNTDVFKINTNVGFFNLGLDIDTSKHIGEKDYQVGDYNYSFSFNELINVDKKTYIKQPLENNEVAGPTFIHPHKGGFINSPGVEILSNLNDETVAEVHVSFNNLYSSEEAGGFLPNGVDPLWFAVDTGSDLSNEESNTVEIPFGFPVFTNNYWSSVFSENENENDSFIEAMYSLSDNQSFVESYFNSNSLAINERIDYVEQNGVMIYAATVTGTVEDLKGLIELDQVSNIEVGEVNYGSK